MSPPPGVSEEAKTAVAQASAVWARLLVEVVYNDKADPTCRKQVREEYEQGWKPFFDAWTDTGVFVRQVADDTQINALIGRTNGLARSCLKDFDTSKLVRGIDIAAERGGAKWLDETMPGGTPPAGGGLKTSTKVLLGVGGVFVIVAGTVIYVTGKVEKLMLAGKLG